MPSYTLHSGFIREALCSRPNMMGGTWPKVPPKHTNYLDRTRPAEKSKKKNVQSESVLIL